MARLLWSLDLELKGAIGKSDLSRQKIYVLWEKEALIVKLRREQRK